ncbi:MAG: hypothetical protein DIZ80_07725 [endosymbiont of Galathealinum brachiosum]|uniref:PilZ domain-containing protein n=1 Tax=endosymbiont of Galathealinum brachiosum TaxID=2200906 RepID=A0A370DGF9_9GAMM|nr:MAG: hypothetical protein DIZ80_07725 [endosymbiont of Galathealinum brachiosum]
MKMLNTNTKNTPDKQDNRTCERLNLEKDLKLYLLNDKILECKSTDISLGGINLAVKNHLNSDYLGSDATITFDTTDREFNCKIVRIDEDQLAVEINKKQAASFGMTLTQNMFRR